jgi:hypothetical protein
MWDQGLSGSRDLGIRNRLAPLDGVAHGLRAAGNPELCVDVCQVSRYRVHADEEPLGDLRVLRAFDNETEHLALTRSQLVEIAGHAFAESDECEDGAEFVVARRPVRCLAHDETCTVDPSRKLPVPLLAGERVRVVVEDQRGRPHLLEVFVHVPLTPGPQKGEKLGLRRCISSHPCPASGLVRVAPPERRLAYRFGEKLPVRCRHLKERAQARRLSVSGVAGEAAP